MKLTKKQVDTCEYNLKGGKGWRNKKDHCLKMINQWQISEKSLTESDLEWFLEKFVPLERARLNRELYNQYYTGERVNYITPTHLGYPGQFAQVEDPQLLRKYHLSWAYRGAVFVLEQIDPDGIHGYMNNPRNKRTKLLKVKLEDLRHLNGNSG